MKNKISADTQFIRSATFKNKDGVEVNIACQPYCVGVYTAITENGRHVAQFGMDYKTLSKFVKGFKKDLEKKGNKDIVINLQTIGNFLSEKDIEFINS
jgi:hypothetical protein